MSAALALGQRAWVSARILWDAPFVVRFRGVLQALLATLLVVALISWNPADPSLNAASSAAPTNWLGANGACSPTCSCSPWAWRPGPAPCC